MEDLYNTCSSSAAGADHHRSSDEISLFLHQILLHSNNSTSSSSAPSSCPSFVAYSGQQSQSYTAPHSVHLHRSSGSMVGLDSCDGMNVGFFAENVIGKKAANNASSLSIGGCNSENETDECDYESEEGLEALVEEKPAKPAPRSSSKRSRAAEVHNLSEKRRRSRINEKMKALQNLIPNSNKTDKASMLDEAIEYLKQLQLQVQMLSMRNGTSLHPICLPGQLQPIQFSQFNRGFDDEIRPQHMKMTCSSLPLNQENQEQIIFDLPNHQCSISNQLSVPNMINSETPFGVDSSIRANFGPFPLRASSELKEICREDVLPHNQLGVYDSERTRAEFEMGTADTTRLHFFESQGSNLKDRTLSGTCIIERDQNECMFLKNIMEDNLIISQNLQRTRTERSSSSDEIKIETRDI